MKRKCWVSFGLAVPLALQASMPPGTISTFARGGPNNIPATQAELSGPLNAAVDEAGNYYVVVARRSPSYAMVYKVSHSGILTAVAEMDLSGTGAMEPGHSSGVR